MSKATEATKGWEREAGILLGLLDLDLLDEKARRIQPGDEVEYGNGLWTVESVALGSATLTQYRTYSDGTSIAVAKVELSKLAAA